MKKRIFAAIALLFSVTLAAAAWTLGFFAPPASALLHTPIQRIELTDLSGLPHSFDELAGAETLLYFFTSWCAPCYKTMTNLQELSEQHDFDVRLLAVALDDNTDGIKDMLETTGFAGEVWLATEGTSVLQRRYFGNERRAIPYVVKLDGNTGIVESTYSPDDAQWKAVLVDGADLGTQPRRSP
jgi:thiol-disulfide isomerase/thioredoxin